MQIRRRPPKNSSSRRLNIVEVHPITASPNFKLDSIAAACAWRSTTSGGFCPIYSKHSTCQSNRRHSSFPRRAYSGIASPRKNLGPFTLATTYTSGIVSGGTCWRLRPSIHNWGLYFTHSIRNKARRLASCGKRTIASYAIAPRVAAAYRDMFCDRCSSAGAGNRFCRLEAIRWITPRRSNSVGVAGT